MSGVRGEISVLHPLAKTHLPQEDKRKERAKINKTTSKRNNQRTTLSCTVYSLQYLQIWPQLLLQECQEFHVSCLHHMCHELEAFLLTMATKIRI